MEELQQLRELVSIVKPLTDEEWDAFSAIWQPYTAKRKSGGAHFMIVQMLIGVQYSNGWLGLVL